MNATTVIRLAARFFILPCLAVCLILIPLQSRAQDSGSLEGAEKFSREELAQMLAPIALYPDALLSQVLMASTYPLEVIEADRWVRRQPDLKKTALDDALLDKDWDPSVKAVCHFPNVLALMSERITETTSLGNAFLAQEGEVLDMIQELRARAYAEGNLTTTDEQKVVVEKETIIIEPSRYDVVYVPYYNPFYIYGPWWYPAYPPYYWGPMGINIGVGIFYWPGIYFGFTFGSWCYFDWPLRYIYIDVYKRPRYVRHDRWISQPGRWHHLPYHRRGVAYRDKFTARKFHQIPYRTRDFRRDTRGFPEAEGQDRDKKRRIDDRTRVEKERRVEDRLKADRERLDRDRTPRERPVREQAESDDQGRQRVDRERKERVRVDHDNQGREERFERIRIERERQPRQRVDREEQPPRDNVFNRVEEGSRERRSSERGRSSRQGLNEGSHGKSRSDGRTWNQNRW